jgi:hypothetical protein
MALKSPLQVYENQRNKPQLRAEAYNFFYEKYIKDPYSDNQVFGDDERFSSQNLPIQPGKIYTYSYDPLTKDSLSFYDVRPFVLVLEAYVKTNENVLIKGVNLNFLPESVRVKLLEATFNALRPSYESSNKEINSGRIGLMRQVANVLKDSKFVFTLFHTKANVPYEFAYRNYIVGRIKNLVQIETEDWSMIPYYIGKEYKEMTAGDIFRLYGASRTELMKKKMPSSSKPKKK